MKIWKRNSYEVVERPFNYDLHCFDVIGCDGEVITTIYPTTIDDMLTIIRDLDTEEDVNGWEDGTGNTIRISL